MVVLEGNLPQKNPGLGIRVRFQIRSFLKPLGFQDAWTFLEISFWGPPILSVSFHGRPTVLILLLNRNYSVPFSSISISIRGNGAPLPSIKGFFNSHCNHMFHFEVEQAPSEWGAHLSRSDSRDCVGKLSRKSGHPWSGSFFALLVSDESHVCYACFLTPVSWLIGPLEWVVITQLTN